MKKPFKIPKPEPNEFRVRQLHMLLAVLLYLDEPDEEEDKVYRMGTDVITPDMLPDSLVFEKRMLEAIMLCSGESPKMTPTPGTIASKIAVRYGVDLNETLAQINKVLELRPPVNVPVTVGMMAYALKREWLDIYRVERSLYEALEKITIPIGNVEDRVQDAARAFVRALPNSRFASTLDIDNGLKKWLQYQDALEKRARQGMTPGPTFPWNGSDSFVSLRKGNMTGITGIMGTGKSTVAAVLAEHWAWNITQGYYVLHIRTETGDEDWWDRRISRYSGVPAYLLERGHNVVLHGQWKRRVENAIAQIQNHMENAIGTIQDVFWPGISQIDFEILVMQHKAIAETRGLELVVIIDYLQNMTWDFRGDDPTKTLMLACQWLKQFASKHQIYLVIFAQADPNVDSKDREKQGQTRGTRELEIASQLFIFIERTKATTDQEMSDPYGEISPYVDPRGYPILLEKTGHHKAYGNLWIKKANNNVANVKIPVFFVNPCFDVQSWTQSTPGSTMPAIQPRT